MSDLASMPKDQASEVAFPISPRQETLATIYMETSQINFAAPLTISNDADPIQEATGLAHMADDALITASSTCRKKNYTHTC